MNLQSFMDKLHRELSDEKQSLETSIADSVALPIEDIRVLQGKRFGIIAVEDIIKRILNEEEEKGS